MSPATLTNGATLVARILGFAWVSIAGLAVDCVVFAGLTAAGLDPLPANLISAGLAVTLVFFASVRQIFRFHGGLWQRYAGYIVFQLAAVSSASLAIAWLHRSTVLPVLVCKLAIIPCSFAGNFTFMRLITSRNGKRS